MTIQAQNSVSYLNTSSDHIYSTLITPDPNEVVADYININIESQSFNTFLSYLNTKTIKALLWKLNIELNQRSDL